jgi:hypothetical protein
MRGWPDDSKATRAGRKIFLTEAGLAFLEARRRGKAPAGKRLPKPYRRRG